MSVNPLGNNPDWFIGNGSLNSNSVIMGRGAEEMDVNDFFNLLAAQLRNQDMFDPQSNTEFIAQMAQFTTLRGMQILQENQLSAYATSFAGKHVTVAHTNPDGSLTRTEGVVSRVTFYDGEPRLIVNNIAFPVFAVMEVHDPLRNVDGPDNETGGPGGSGITDLNTAAGFIGKTVTIRIQGEEEYADRFTEVTGRVLGVMRDANGNINFQLDDGNEYNVRWMVGVSTATDDETEDEAGDE
ncbi:MAG: hypothetical protein FWE32_06480 [Oscillospiraceae bacterium]|nr:hypothetical protein [Oscillospiraceae bacterium]